MSAIYGIERFHARKENYQTIDRDVLEYCDVCIIGSGASGAVLAKKFCDAGRSVVLLEKGGYFEGEDMNQRDEDMLPLLWKNSGANFTEDLRIAIAQGSCLGGSTIINDAVCFEIPDIVREQWKEMGIDISDKEWESATREVSDAIRITEVRDDELGNNSLMLKKGCELMGYTKHYPNKRNSFNCMQCGLCHLGCHYGTKQDMRVTYIHRSLNNPKSSIRIYCNCSAEKITFSDNEVDGVEGNFLDRSGSSIYKIRVNAKLVIVAAGAIASTHLLQKNSIAKGKAGRGLALHPSPFIIGDFPFEIKGIQGIPMAYTLHEFGVTSGIEDGFLIEGIYLPPLQFSMLLPVSGGKHEELMKRYNHYAMAGILIRDRSNGVITLTDLGFPRVAYSLGTKELENIARGAEIIARMWFRLGATRVITSHISKPILKSENEIPELANAIINDSKNLLLGSAHPQGGNRMGNDPNDCVVDSNGKVHGFRNLFVCDASVFPTAVGVNPQLTVMSLAEIIANRINNRWNEFASTELKDRPGEVCSIKQPMYCSVRRLDEMYEISDNMKSKEALINSADRDIVDGDNWSFDPGSLTIWNNRYWKGFFAADHDLVNTALVYGGGFWKRFWKDGSPVKGETYTYESSVSTASEAIETEYPGFGKVILLKYRDPPYNRFYDLLKIIDKDTVLGKAYAARDPPRGEHILTFSMSKKYSVDFMTHDDFKIIFSRKAVSPGIDDVPGIWEGKLISDSTSTPVMFRFRYYMEKEDIKCKYLFGGILPGTSDVRFTEELMLMFDFTGQLFRDEIRMVRKDFMVGKYCIMKSPVFDLLKRAPGFIMKDDSRVCLPYVLHRVV